MKVPISEVNQDIDAGWDEIAPAAPPMSLASKPIDSQPPEVDDLDAGWEMEPSSSERLPNQSNCANIVRPASQTANQSVNSQVSLTKKARRELERQHRMHEAKRRAEAKTQRKEQRRVQAARNDVIHSGSKPEQRIANEQDARSRSKGKARSLEQKPKSPSSGGRMLSGANPAEERQVSRNLTKPPTAAPDTSAVVVKPVQTRSRSTKAMWLIALFAIGLVIVAVRWLR